MPPDKAQALAQLAGLVAGLGAAPPGGRNAEPAFRALIGKDTLGAYGESEAAAAFKATGYAEIVSLQNESGHGIDIAARKAGGPWEFVEVKTTMGEDTPRLRGEQRNARDFIRSRLERAAVGQGAWKNADPSVRQAARRILDDMDKDPRRVTSHVVRVCNANSCNQFIDVGVWTSE